MKSENLKDPVKKIVEVMNFILENPYKFSQEDIKNKFGERTFKFYQNYCLSGQDHYVEPFTQDGKEVIFLNWRGTRKLFELRSLLAQERATKVSTKINIAAILVTFVALIVAIITLVVTGRQLDIAQQQADFTNKPVLYMDRVNAQVYSQDNRTYASVSPCFKNVGSFPIKYNLTKFVVLYDIMNGKTRNILPRLQFHPVIYPNSENCNPLFLVDSDLFVYKGNVIAFFLELEYENLYVNGTAYHFSGSYWLNLNNNYLVALNS